MKDAFDITLDVSRLLDDIALKALMGLDGQIFQTERPSGRNGITDIVVNAIGITNRAIQKGSGNVNIYAPTITNNGVKVADQVMLKALTKVVIPLIDQQYKDTFQTWLDKSPTMMQDTDGSYFVNISFEYQSVQDDYQNI